MTDARGSILFLGYDDSRTGIIGMLRERGYLLTHTAERVADLAGPDVIISYGYRHILPMDVLATARRPAVNLHVAYLPYNRGAHPNFWSFFDNTPSGVTIHEMDGGVDTGPIIAQRYVNFDRSETTFSSTYDRLRREMEALFLENLDAIVHGSYVASPQRGRGTYHSKKDLPPTVDRWDVDIQSTLMTVTDEYHRRRAAEMRLVDEIERTRTRNNVNWMDLLRIALSHAPDETKRVIGKINADDGAISELLRKLSGQ